MFKYLLKDNNPTFKCLLALVIRSRHLRKYYYFIKILKDRHFWPDATICLNPWTGNLFRQSLSRSDLGCRFAQPASPLSSWLCKMKPNYTCFRRCFLEPALSQLSL